MSNLYATPTEIKVAMPEGIRSATTDYDALLYKLSMRMSRVIDRYCSRQFFPSYGIRYFDVTESSDELWIPDLFSITSIEYSEDDGYSYTALTASDYYGTVAGESWKTDSYTLLITNPNGLLGYWPAGHKSIKITGWWAYVDNRDTCWEDSGDTVKTDLTISGLSLAVNDADGADQWGVTPRFHNGLVLKIESEILEATTVVAATTNTVAVVRGRNGSTAAAHTTTNKVYIWRPAEAVKQAALIMAVRQMERGLQGFGDARATGDLGTMIWTKAIDPEARGWLDKVVRY